MRSSSAKREQLLYSPGSGPLRKTQLSESNQSLNIPRSESSPSPTRTNSNTAECRNSSSISSLSKESCRDKNNREQTGGSVNSKLDSHGNHSGGAGMHYVRHESEPPMASANSSKDVEPTGYRNGHPELNCDARSKKPPILSIAYLETLPPRLLKQTLQDNGLPHNYLNDLRAEQQRDQAHARGSHQPSKGRMRYLTNGNGGGGGGVGGGYANANHGGRWKDEEHQPSRFISRNSSCDRPRTMSWSSGSNNFPFNNRSNWFGKGGCKDEELAVEVKSTKFNAATEVDAALPPPSGISANFAGKTHQMRSGGSHSLGRGAASGRYYGPDRDKSRDRYISGGGNSGDGGGRCFMPNSRDRYQNQSREAGMAGRNVVAVHPAVTSGSWRRGGNNNRDQSRHPPSDQAVKPIAEMTKQFEKSVCIQKCPGVLVLPPKVSTGGSAPDRALPGESVREGGRSIEAVGSEPKLLFDPKNPSRPIVVEQPQLRPLRLDQQYKLQVCVGLRWDKIRAPEELLAMEHRKVETPLWHYPNAPQAKLTAQCQLLPTFHNVSVFMHRWLKRHRMFDEWEKYTILRGNMQHMLERFLQHDMRFAQDVNLEQNLWKLMYHNVIDNLRMMLIQETNQEEKQMLKKHALEVVEDGIEFFEKLLALLQHAHKFRLEQFVGANAATNVKGLRCALALVSAQKICLFLGDLVRYLQLFNESHRYCDSRDWYVKAQQILPKNGRPYNQLALLSLYTNQNLEAIYFYIRSLMSSNPFESARESLMDLFNDIKKRYEIKQSKREERRRQRLTEKEHHFDGNLRRETWIHPDGGSRVHRTALLDPVAGETLADDTGVAEELRRKRICDLSHQFNLTFLYMLGKLVTKTGMESFRQCLKQMLLEFRVLMQHTPMPVAGWRLVQLMALNMYAIDVTKRKAAAPKSDYSGAPEPRSELQEWALVVSLLMFSLQIERFVELLRNPPPDFVERDVPCEPVPTPATPGVKLILHDDAKQLLRGISVWCDWMICHLEVWNPPPARLSDYKLNNSRMHDPWSTLAELVTILENVDTGRGILTIDHAKGRVQVRLPEDITLAGFRPMKNNQSPPIYVPRGYNIEAAQDALRLQKIIHFGTIVLCRCDPPVLGYLPMLPDGKPTHYFSVINTDQKQTDLEIMLESFSDEEPEEVLAAANGADKGEGQKSPEPKNADESSPTNDPAEAQADGEKGAAEAGGKERVGGEAVTILETRKLLRRKYELERKQRMQEKHNRRLQNILSQSPIALHIEVRPRLLVPDTNCFIDYLSAIQLITHGTSLYQLMVPIVVINELEGLSKGVRETLGGTPAAKVHIQHIIKVSTASTKALLFLKSRNPNVKCVTTKGSVLKTTTFTVEGEGKPKMNDDRILETALNLCRQSTDETRDGTRYVTRDVVLLTTDRNLRVKALANDLPVREVPDFVKWAGLGYA